MGAERLELLIADAPQRHKEMHVDGFNPRPGPHGSIFPRLVLGDRKDSCEIGQ